jgi:pimeloyl-ACP methyl ester carboxylesterase
MKRTVLVVTALLLLFASLRVPAQSVAGAREDRSRHREGFVTSERVRLHYLDWGGVGPNLVFLTGFGSTAHDFDKLADHFASRFRVIALTRRGRSPSDEPASGYDLARLTADVKAVMDGLSVDRAHLVGHSMAGTEMMQFARLYPERLLSMVFIDAAVDPAAAWRVMIKDPQGPPTSPAGSVSEQIDRWWNTHPSDFTAVRVPALALFAVQNQHPYPPAGASTEMRARLDEYWQTDWNALVTRTAEKFQREVPGGRVVMMKGPHYLYRENEADVIRELDEFYRSVLPK